jgi:hypothetical protein
MVTFITYKVVLNKLLALHEQIENKTPGIICLVQVTVFDKILKEKEALRKELTYRYAGMKENNSIEI